jgi:5-formyltetrahydrofolate cyclo-ligase
MSPKASELKAQLRLKLRSEAQRFSPADRAAASTRICQRLIEQDIWKRARSVLFYFPMREEPNIHPLFATALGEGKTAALPRYFPPAGHYEACEVRDLDHDLQPGAFGIYEPAPWCPIFDLKKLDLALVPGVGFALSGFRLGRGKGYYDRLLAEIPGFKCGVAFEWQVAIEIPAESHDICVDCILTPTRWHKVAGWREG